VNGRHSRRVVLLAFFCTDTIGALLWAFWCEEHWGPAGAASSAGAGGGATGASDAWDEHARACGSLGINRFLLLCLAVPAEGAVLFLAGRNPWSFWSDGLLLPLWLLRLTLLDAMLWSVSPKMLLGDALWFSVVAVLCRVHSLALLILVGSQAGALYLLLTWHGALAPSGSFEFVRFGVYSIVMLVIMACAYVFDEQSRLQSFEQLMFLQDQNAALAERLLRSKGNLQQGSGEASPHLELGLPPLAPASPAAVVRPTAAACPLADGAALGTSSLSATLSPWPPSISGWHHVVLEDPSERPISASSRSTCSGPRSVDLEGALPLPPPALSFAGSPPFSGRPWARAKRGGRLLLPTRRPRQQPPPPPPSTLTPTPRSVPQPATLPVRTTAAPRWYQPPPPPPAPTAPLHPMDLCDVLE